MEPADQKDSAAVSVYQQDEKSSKEFNTNLNKYIDEIQLLTPLTVNSMTIESEFGIYVRIEMEPYNRFFGSTNEWGEDCIPIIIRSRKDGNHIHDMM